MRLQEDFFETDLQGFAGGVEPAFLSASESEEVAIKYSALSLVPGMHQCRKRHKMTKRDLLSLTALSPVPGEGREQVVFKLLLSKTSLGAEVAWLSQFPDERERLFHPWTYLQVVGPAVRREDGVTVVTLKCTPFQNVHTVEEITCRRKNGIIMLASSLAWDLRTEAARAGMSDGELETRLDALEGKLLRIYAAQAPEWYHVNARY